MTFPNSLRIAILAAICGTAAPLSLAQGPPKDEVLRGPAVNDRDVPGAKSQFGKPEGRPDKFHRDPRIAHRQFMDAVRSLEGPEVAPDLRLAEAQLAQIDAIDTEFRAALDAFRAEHKAEIDALKEQAGDMREDRRERGPRPDGPPDANREKSDMAAPDPDVAAARDQLKALKDGGPKPEDFHTRIWAVLSPAQQALAQSRIDATRDDRRERIGDEMRERRGPRGERGPDGDRGPRGERGADARPDRDGPPPRGERSSDQRLRGERGGPDGPPRRGAEGFPPNPRLAHFIDRFNSLPPEAQDRMIQRMDEMLSKMEGRGDRRGPKPPPPLDDVAVPPPPAADDAGEPMPPPAPESH